MASQPTPSSAADVYTAGNEAKGRYQEAAGQYMQYSQAMEVALGVAREVRVRILVEVGWPVPLECLTWGEG